MQQERIERVLEVMRTVGVDQLLVCSPASFYYLTDQWVHPGERFLGLLLGKDGTQVCMANHLFGLGAQVDCRIIRYSDSENPIAALAEAMTDGGTLGVDSALSANFLLDLLGRLNHTKIVPADECVLQVRMVKDVQEIERMKRSSEINDATMADIIGAIHPALTELELSHKLPEFYCRHGADGYKVVPIVSYGGNCADAHHAPDGSYLSAGDSIVIDMGVPYKSYCSDMTRTVFYGDVNPKWEKIYHIVLKAQEAAIAAVRPGVACSKIDRIARDIITSEGYGPQFNHRTGHNIGIEGHEFPSIGLGNDMPLREGMIFSIEPGIYIPGEAGVRIEDLVVVTKDGCEILNSYPKNLQVLPLQ